MKYLVIFALIFASANAVSREFLQAMIQKVTQLAATCAQETHATPSDLAELMAHKFPPTTHEARCTILCFYKTLNVANDDGSVNKDGFVEAFAELKVEDAGLYDKVLQIVTDCNTKTPPTDDPCETVTAIATCTKQQSDSMNLLKELFS